ncbi:MAG: MarR family winged helix-turn-helix transcriptional regulator [Romboutsia sp.]|uniref:MarR family winged helix-turn-helix transcriptional regulator n=1 Tax=Romboutsia sp. TaxID=1965302 RepID=UPI003F2F95D0
MRKNVCTDEETKLNISTLKKFTKVRHRINRLEYEVITKGGVTVSQYDVLMVLYHNGDLKVGSIMEKTLTTPGNITVVINNLEKDGLVTRIRNTEDKRAINISITNKGISIVKEIIPKHTEIINKILNVLDTKEKIILQNILDKMK